MNTIHLTNNIPLISFCGKPISVAEVLDFNSQSLTALSLDEDFEIKKEFYLRLFSALRFYSKYKPHRLVINSMKIIITDYGDYGDYYFAFEDYVEEYSLYFSEEVSYIHNLGKVLHMCQETLIKTNASAKELSKILYLAQMQLNGFESLIEIPLSTMLVNVDESNLKFSDTVSNKFYYFNYTNKPIKDRVAVYDSGFWIKNRELVIDSKFAHC